ncbi:hypothetical protein CDV36_016599, partial [Fusarium kuroshium]
RGWISCVIATGATEILPSARSGCRCCPKMAMCLMRLLLWTSLILFQLIWVPRRNPSDFITPSPPPVRVSPYFTLTITPLTPPS